MNINKKDKFNIATENHRIYYIINISIIVIITLILSYITKTDVMPEPTKSFCIVGLSIIFFISFIYLISKTSLNNKDEKTTYLSMQILLFVISSIIISPQIVYLIGLYFKVNSKLILNVGSVSDWISFSGSLLGGSLTLLAVLFAFVLEKKQRESDIDLRSIPKIIVDWYFSKDIKTGRLSKEALYEFEHSLKDINYLMKIHLINDSENVSTDLELLESKLIFFKNIHEALNDDSIPLQVFDLTEKHSIESNLTNVLFNNSEIIMNLPIIFPIEYTYIDIDNSFLARLRLKIRYRSLLKIRDYVGTFEINFHIKELLKDDFSNQNKTRYVFYIEPIRCDYEYLIRKQWGVPYESSYRKFRS